ncbi:MAG: hypothetical protein NZ521_03250, partial [Flammeovirgaceae bacterium]|nr:hypothetical protein [Flammeovirgaceae bacterium]
KQYIFAVRRYEKDYLLRNDTSYVHKMLEASDLLKKSISQSTINQEKKALYKEWIERHNNLFLKVVEIDLILGYKERSGLSMKLARQIDELDKLVYLINHRANYQHNRVFTIFQTVVVVIVTFSVILTLLLSMAFKFVLDDKKLQE